MSYIKSHLEMCRQAFGKNLYNDFMVEHGVTYAVGPKTFAGPRGTPKHCYENATHLAFKDRSLTYVEGKVAIHGVPIDHAWCVDADGIVVDPTLRDNAQDRVIDYFGVPFKLDYVVRAALVNDTYGLLDFYYARQTVPKLYELGLEAGQQWLLDQATICRERVVQKLKRKKGRAA